MMTYSEHDTRLLENSKSLTRDKYVCEFPKKRENQLCFNIWKNETAYHVETGYFVGVDWIEENIKSIYVEPKLNTGKDSEDVREINYLQMLFNCLKHQETANLLNELIHVKWDAPQIEIKQEVDILTPFLIVDFLNTIKKIVNKGLKKSYYRTTKTLNGRIKGKLLMKQTMRMHLSKGNLLPNVCSFDEFGVDNKENRLLKKALEFIKNYMMASPLMEKATVIDEMIAYISPAFEKVSSDIEVNEIKQMTSNTLFKEYDSGIRLAKMILRRFGYNISSVANEEIATPPFWIDMPMLFELHVLSLLKDGFKDEIVYHLSTSGNELDFLLKEVNYEMVIDAKYKTYWKHNNPVHEDVRQVSGYSRLKRVYSLLTVDYPKSIDCLIIYPDLETKVTSIDKNTLKNSIKPVDGYHGFYKLGVKIPVIDQP